MCELHYQWTPVVLALVMCTSQHRVCSPERLQVWTLTVKLSKWKWTECGLTPYISLRQAMIYTGRNIFKLPTCSFESGEVACGAGRHGLRVKNWEDDSWDLKQTLEHALLESDFKAFARSIFLLPRFIPHYPDLLRVFYQVSNVLCPTEGIFHDFIFILCAFFIVSNVLCLTEWIFSVFIFIQMLV